MNRMISITRVFLFIILISGISYSQITLTLPTVSGATGNDITNAAVTVNDLTGKNISSYQFQINYNPSIIKIYGATTSGSISSGSITSSADTVNGTIRLAWASADPIVGSGTLLYLKIKIKAAGTSNINYAATGTYPGGGTFTSMFGNGSNVVTPVNGTGTSTGGNNAPTLNLAPGGPYSVQEGTALNIQMSGTDADPGDVVTYAYTATPALTGATINSTTGAFSWTPPINQTGVYNVTFIATDGKTPKNIITTITVTKINIAPTLTISPEGPYSILDGATLSVTLTGTDANTGDVLTYSYASSPSIPGAVFNSATHVFSVTASPANHGTYNLTFSVTDGMATKQISTTLVIGNTPPTLSLNPSGPYAVDEGSPLTITAVGADANAGDVLTYSYTSTPVITGANFNSTNGVFSWTPATNQAGNYSITFKVTDGKVAIPIQVTTTITVNKVNLAPTLTIDPAGPYLVYEGKTINITLVGIDPNSGDVLTYSITSPATLPEGVKLTGNVFSWTPNYEQGTTAPYSFSFRVKDQSGLFASKTIQVIVGNTNQAPTFTTELPAGQVAIVNTPVPVQFSFQYRAEDHDGDMVYFSLVSAPFGSSITADGLYTWSPTVAQAGQSYVVTVQASDGTLSAQSTQIIKASSVVGINTEGEIPTEYKLAQNYPNPFNPATTINYSLPVAGNVKLSVYDILGREVSVLVDKYLSAGYHSVNFDASQYSSGLYIYKIQSNNFVSIKKMMLMK